LNGGKGYFLGASLGPEIFLDFLPCFALTGRRIAGFPS